MSVCIYSRAIPKLDYVPACKQSMKMAKLILECYFGQVIAKLSHRVIPLDG
jgi:hypothetical protein